MDDEPNLNDEPDVKPRTKPPKPIGMRRRNLNKAERQRKAWQLRLSGKHQYDIARALGCSQQTVSADLKIMADKYRQEHSEDAERITLLMVQQLDQMLEALWPKVMRGDNHSVLSAISILTRQAKLIGCDGPVLLQLQTQDDAISLRAKIAAALDRGKPPIPPAREKSERLPTLEDE